MFEIKVKICGMKDPENIRSISKLNPDLFGLIFYQKSKRYVDDSKAKNILESIPKDIDKVGVFVNENSEELKRKINLFELDYIQLHGDESPEYCAELKKIDVKIIKAFGVDEKFNFSRLDTYSECCDFFLFDTKSKDYGGTGIKFNWDLLRTYKNIKPIFLSGGLEPEDAEEIKKLDFLNLFAIDLNSKFEIKPALKDYNLLKQFLDTLNISEKL